MQDEMQILIVIDDYPIALDVEQEMSSIIGCVPTITNSNCLSELLSAHQWDIIFLDSTVSQDLSTNLETLFSENKATVICISSSEERIPHLLRKRIFATIIKPFDMSEMVQIVQSAIKYTKDQNKSTQNVGTVLEISSGP